MMSARKHYMANLHKQQVRP